jgi:GMP synthase (glutamine-hydrolysing)
MKNIITIFHTPCEQLGTIMDVLSENSVNVKIVEVYNGDVVPLQMEDAHGLIIMGGPMSVYEEIQYPHLSHEVTLIQDALKRSLPVLGICLGSQLIAKALGAKVYPGKCKEIGWHLVRLHEAALHDPLFDEQTPFFQGFHWHGDIFDLPSGAIALAESELTKVQAFRYGGNVYGLLFHLEVDQETIAGMARAFPSDLQEAGLSLEDLVRQNERYVDDLRSTGGRVFREWVRLI